MKIILGIVTLLLLNIFFTRVLIEPWVREKIQKVLRENGSTYGLEIDKVNILMIRSGIELEGITFLSTKKQGSTSELKGAIASIKFTGIRFFKIIFNNDIDIHKITISNSRIKAIVPFPEQDLQPIVSPLDIRIGKIIFNQMDLSLKSSSTAKSYVVKEGILRVFALHVKKQDTLSSGILKQFDFEAAELASISADSMYTYTANGIIYSKDSKTLAADNLSIHPNYTNYDFTSRYKYQIDRFEASFSKLSLHNFYADKYFSSTSLISSYIEIRKMDINIFRDKRKEFLHVNRPVFQDLMYNYPGMINIDTICVLNGNITYLEHAEEANEPGSITFNEINADIFKITNDTIYKTKEAYLKFECDALLMGKGKLAFSFKGRLFDPLNTFSLNGTLSAMETKELNPMLEKNAFIYATSGNIDNIDFSLTANNKKANGKMTLLYNGLHLTLKNKRTDETTALRERLKSFIVNLKVMDSNPLPGEKVRVGFIDYDRDTEKFIISYCVKSILSGIKSSLDNNPKK